MKAIGKKIFDILYSYLAIILFLIIWEVLPHTGLINPVFLPPFSTVIKELFRLLVSGELIKHITISLTRSFLGFFLGLAVAIPLGLLIGWFRNFEKFIDPLIQLFRNLSVLSILPVFVLIFGIGEVSKVAVIFWGVLWAVILNTISGVKSVDPILIKGAKTMGVSNFELFSKVILPGALPSIFTGIRISATTSILVLIAAEMIGANTGLGYALYFYQVNFKTPAMYGIIIIMAALGVAINYVLTKIEIKAFSWKEKLPN